MERESLASRGKPSAGFSGSAISVLTLPVKFLGYVSLSMKCADFRAQWHTGCIVRSCEFASTSPRGSRRPKTPRLAGCGATSPSFFCPLFLACGARCREGGKNPAFCRRQGGRVSKKPSGDDFFRSNQRASASRRMIGTKESKSTGFGTCRSKPASIAASISVLDA